MTTAPRFTRLRRWPAAIKHRALAEPELPEPPPLSPPEINRRRIAFMVIGRLALPGLRVAVVIDSGRAALVNCREQLFDVLAQDHLIVGVYTFGATVRDVMEDLQAAGL